MSRRIVFVGGAQVRALARVYRADIADELGDEVIFVGTEQVSREAAQAAIGSGDAVVVEVGDDGPVAPDSLLSPTAQIARVPVFIADFLWPFATEPHPDNTPISALPDGPYPADHGDRFLNRLMAEGVPEDEAVARYLALDIAAETDLEGMLRDRIARQTQLDAQTGFDLADFVSRNFRTGDLFAARGKLRRPAFRELARAVFRQLGVPAHMTAEIRHAPFAGGRQPIHPGVIQYFGLSFVTPTTRYPMTDEGRFTFEQYCRRYYRGTWNRALHEAVEYAESEPVAALPALERALLDAPESQLGLRMLDYARHAAQGISGPDLGYVFAEDDGDTPEEAAAFAAAAAELAKAKQAAAEMAHAEQQAAELAAAEREATRAREAIFTEPASPEPEPLPEPAQAEAAAPAPEPRQTPEPEPAPIAAMEPVTPAPPEPAKPAARSIRKNFGAPARPIGASDIDPAPTAAAAPPVFVPAAFTPMPEASTASAEAATPVYVELPPTGHVAEPPPSEPPPPPRDLHTPLAPSHDLIQVLPRMLPTNFAMAGGADRPFADMQETMPPPPLRPILPPELLNEPPKRGVLARMLGLFAND